MDAVMPTAEDRKMSRETISTWKKRTAWQPDAEAAECPICAVEFSLTVRRHHCRACGRCVCADCSKGKMVVAGYEDPERACDDCREGAQPSAAARMCGSLLQLLGCVESPEARARRERRKLLTDGCVFSRKRGMLFSKQKVVVKLTNDGGISVAPVDKSLVEAEKEEFPLIDIDSVSYTPGETKVGLKDSLNVTLVELDGNSARICEKFADGVREALEDQTTAEEAAGSNSRRPATRTRAARAAKKKYFKAKDVELTARKEEAERRKKKILGGRSSSSGGSGLQGLKYTAIAMANRDSLGGGSSGSSSSRASRGEGTEY
jgi:hypothetical protein